MTNDHLTTATKSWKTIFALVLAVTLLLCVFGTVHAKELYPMTPCDNHGKKWRIGCYQGGPFMNYPMVLTATVKGLMEMDWIAESPIPKPKDPMDTRELWIWLCQNADSRYIEFVKDAFWSARWSQDKRKNIKAAVITRLNQAKDIDLMIGIGTWAGQDLANNLHSTPTLIISSTDPIRAGFIKSVTDSGFDHVHARLDPDVHKRQIRFFHTLFDFKKLGMVYENTKAGSSYAGVADAEEIGKEKGFDIVRCYSIDDNPDRNLAAKSVKTCYQQIAPRIDAIYVTIQTGVREDTLGELITPLIQNKIPSFAQEDARWVRHGVLMSVSKANFKYVGRFHAQTIAQIFNGAKPRDLEQVFEDPLRISINLETARQIGFTPPPNLMRIADEVYDDIEP